MINTTFSLLWQTEHNCRKMLSKLSAEVLIEMEVFIAPNCFKLIVTTKRLRWKCIFRKGFEATKREKEKWARNITLWFYSLKIKFLYYR